MFRKPKHPTVSGRVPPALHSLFKQEAERRKLTRSELLRELLTESLAPEGEKTTA